MKTRCIFVSISGRTLPYISILSSCLERNRRSLNRIITSIKSYANLADMVYYKLLHKSLVSKNQVRKSLVHKKAQSSHLVFSAACGNGQTSTIFGTHLNFHKQDKN
jgi:hypothetical protein